MKSGYLNRHKNRGFTIIEVVVSILILSSFIGTLMYLYSRSTESFKLTVWKQERTAQASMFWTFMRKHLEEATNNLDITSQVGNANPVFPENPCPLKFHPNPNSVAKGNILAWNVSRVEFADAPPYAHSSVNVTFYLEKAGRRLLLKSSDSLKNIATLDDVEDIKFNLSSVIRTANNEDQIKPGIDVDAVGAFIELSLTLSPPRGNLATDMKIPQNHKFRLNVGLYSDANPSY